MALGTRDTTAVRHRIAAATAVLALIVNGLFLLAVPTQAAVTKNWQVQLKSYIAPISRSVKTLRKDRHPAGTQTPTGR